MQLLVGPLWTWIFLVIMVGALVGYFMLVTGSYAEKYAQGAKTPQRYMVAFGLAIGIGVVALLIPMDIFGVNFMFTVHMIQHLLFALVVPPLLLLGMPPWLLERFFVHTSARRVSKFLVIPYVASLLFNANLWIWHAPPLFQAMMGNDFLHMLVDVLYILTGVLFWWPLLNPLPDVDPHLPLGGKLAYLFFSDMPMMLLGAGMIFSGQLYSMDMIGSSGTILHMTIKGSDQQLGGLLMWIVGSIYFIVLASIFFLRWMLRQEAREQAEVMYEDVGIEEADEEEDLSVQLRPSVSEVSEG